MTYTDLTTNELVMLEGYYQENIKVSDTVTSLGRSKQTIYNVINYLKEDLPWEGKRKPKVIAKNEENKPCAEICVREQTVILILRRNSVI